MLKDDPLKHLILLFKEKNDMNPIPKDDTSAALMRYEAEVARPHGSLY
jgi:hypothetical protein